MNNLQLKFRRLHEGIADLPLPSYATEDSAGMDLRCSEDISLQPGEIILAPTGLSIEIPKGYEGQVRPRSGLAAKHGITVPNSPGTIDADYRGELKVILQNLGKESVAFERGSRIAQLVIAKYERVNVVEVDELAETARAEGGFGHSGVK
jgi:dUTP pyrophosphatase